MKLIKSYDGKPINTGDMVRDQRGAVWVVEGHDYDRREVYLRDTTEKRMHRTARAGDVGVEWVD